ncbi:DUF3536 domain-containing protein [Sphaerochaeta sp. PS]|uniref:DUF3536 domain-containing protein n=1 Tax=Sphaerochaeta sp. PS TaxID=3076336 RepID=UPI0028A520DF|nr:DUF3536 domain-containing protein [Sphaerochaeta sp. PS]MDT4762910.1 DUF3536 domain-containing protein [Sphaerochaeta sp. PS]
MNKIQNTVSDLILHGHFYQPPRENPRTGIIGKQLSATPYPDWNERIYADCYNANAHSRYLSGVRRIVSMTNNYEYISFNFGPTLLSWLKRNHPDTHDSIIQADKKSVERLGHGNAMAQSFNHSILPLCTEAEARAQIAWGLKDFSLRFGREAEGMWLPETGINPMVIDLLAEYGLSFVILSPWQCKSIEDENGQMVDLAGKSAPYGKPFILTGEKGRTISAFFYNPSLAEGISFGHLLQDADNLYARLLTIKAEEQQDLIHTATDGEIYGHHEPYGDMALAALIRKVEERSDFRLTNYATYLEKHPATLHAQLHEGEAGKGTSWSCVHGVSRWYKDCGCHTGGDESWNQKWRTPLRESFDNLSKKIDTCFQQEIARIFSGSLEPQPLVESFGPVISKLISMEEFLDSIGKEYPFAQEERTNLASLLLGIQYRHFAYTSCGWFFNDLSGLEPKQNIVYALMAVELYKRFSEEDMLESLLSDLKLAISNRRQDGDGEDLALEALDILPGEVEATLFFVLNRRIALKEDQVDSYGWFRLEKYDYKSEQTQILEISNTFSLIRYQCSVLDPAPGKSELTYTLTIRDMRNGEIQSYFIDSEDIPSRMRDQLFVQIDNGICRLESREIKKIAREIHHYASLAKATPYLPMGSLYQENIGSCLRAMKSLFKYGTLPMWDEFKESFIILLGFFVKYAKTTDLDIIRRLFNSEMEYLAEKIQAFGLYDKNIRFILEFLQIVRDHAFQPDLTQIQNAVYPYLSMEKKPHKDTDIDLINALGKALNFDISIH